MCNECAAWQLSCHQCDRWQPEAPMHSLWHCMLDQNVQLSFFMPGANWQPGNRCCSSLPSHCHHRPASWLAAAAAGRAASGLGGQRAAGAALLAVPEAGGDQGGHGSIGACVCMFGWRHAMLFCKCNAHVGLRTPPGSASSLLSFAVSLQAFMQPSAAAHPSLVIML